jgi:hypothetical protein
MTSSVRTEIAFAQYRWAHRPEQPMNPDARRYVGDIDRISKSGRYRMRGAKEMAAIERAFVESGYRVWSMGYNQDVNRPNSFGLSDLEWVSP